MASNSSTGEPPDNSQACEDSVEDNSQTDSDTGFRHFVQEFSDAINMVLPPLTPKGHLERGGITRHKEPILCVRREHGEATVFCRDCHQFYCEECVSNHKLFDMMAGHRKRQIDRMSDEEVEDAKSDRARKNCGKHGQLFTALCRRCNQLLCASCWSSGHKNHDVKDGLEFVIETQEEIEEASAGEPEFLTNQNDELAERLGEQWERVQADVKCAKREVKKTFQQVLVLAKTHETDMIRDIERVGSNVRKAMKRELTTNNDASLENHPDATDQSAILTNTLGATGQAASLKNALEERADVKAVTQRRGVPWKFAIDRRDMTAESLKLKLGSVNLTPPTIISDVRSEVSLEYEGKYGPSGMVVLGNILCVTHAYNKNLWLYDTSSGATEVRYVPELKRPTGLCLLDREEGLVVVADNNVRGRLHFLKISQNMSMTDHKTMDMPFKDLYCITVSLEFGEMLLSGVGALYVCSLEGDVRRKISVPDKTYDTIRSICRLETGYAVLSTDDDWQGVIRLLTEDGTCTQTLFREEGEQISVADHMTADRMGRLIASDRDEDKLHIVDTTSGPPKTSIIQLEDYYQPCCVYLDKDTDVLYVAGCYAGQRKVSVYEWHPSPAADDGNRRHFELNVKLLKF